MITRVRVKNFRSLADVDVTLGPLTVLVGRNGAGKSTFVDVLRFVRDALRFGMEEALRKRNGLNFLRRWLPEGTGENLDIEIKLDVEGLSATGTYSFRFAATESGSFKILEEDCQFGEESFTAGEGKWISHGFFGASEQLVPILDPQKLLLPLLTVWGQGTLKIAYQLLTSGSYYGLIPIDTLRSPQKETEPLPLDEDASNLASLLQHMQKKGTLPIVTDALNRIIEDIEDIRITPVGGYLTIQLKHETRQPNEIAPWFDLSQESDGTIHILTILAALYQNYSTEYFEHYILGIEEPETALYPAALSILSGIIKEVALNQQVIVATQSPDFISEFRADNLQIIEQHNGLTFIGPLLSEQVDAVNRSLFTTGDLLRIEGLRTTPFEAMSVGDA